MRIKVSHAATAILATSLLTLTGCTTLHVGVGVRDPHANADAVNASLLDTGRYPTTPRAALGKADSRAAGATVESHRLADTVLVPFEIDPNAISQKDALAFVSNDAIRTNFNFGSLLAPWGYQSAGLDDYHLVCGFATYAGLTGNLSSGIRHTVIEFESEQDASTAATAMYNAARKGHSLDTDTRRDYPIPGSADIHAVSEFSNKGEFRRIFSYTAHGPFVIADQLDAKNPVDAEHAAVAAVTQQIPRLDDFHATPVDQLEALPLDPTDLLARTLPSPKSGRGAWRIGTYTPHAALHFTSQPLRTQTIFNSAGMNNVAIDAAIVYEAKDAVGAGAIADDIVSEYAQKSYPSYSYTDPQTTLRDVHCLTSADTAVCVTHVDRYTIQTLAGKPVEAGRAINAQYLMLTAK